ncbi:MAG TPA: ROK family protein [Actinospica sp.]|nr:ROK family protein [Actinospica sp.]
MRNIVIAPGAPSGTPGSATIGLVNSPTGSADVRRRNLSLVLRHVAAFGPCARTELAEATGLVHASITALTAELIGSGLVHEVGLASSGARGRPRRLLELAPGRVLTIAIQVTQSQLISAATDLGGAVLWRDERAHGAEFGDPRPVVRAISEIVHEAWNDVRGSGDRKKAHLARVVIAVPGAVVEDEVVADSILLGWRRVDLRSLLRAQDAGVTCPISIVNEANMAAFAEYRALVDRTGGVPKVFAYLRVVRTGIGGGLVVDGAVQTGGHGMAGEFGHIPVSFDGPACKCGDRGCLVTYLGVRALLAAAGMDPDGYEDLEAGRVEFDRRLRGGDPAAVRALETGARALSTALTAVSRVADPEQVVLGGHLAAWSDWLVPNVLRHLAGRRAVTPTDEPVISTDLLGEDATLQGALRFGCETVLDDPTSVPLVTI